MYHGKHTKENRRSRARVSKAAVLFLAALLLIGAAAGSTLAFLIDKTEPMENSFEYAMVSCEVTDNSGNSNVQVKNTGTTDAYIRATYVINWVDSSGNIAASVPEGYTYNMAENPDGKWVKGKDGYFYYTSPVAPGASTEGSLSTCTATYPDNPEYTLSVEVLAQAIQSVPEDAVKAAWGSGFSIGSDGSLIVPGN